MKRCVQPIRLLALAALVPLTAAGCAEETVVHAPPPPLAGLPGARVGGDAQHAPVPRRRGIHPDLMLPVAGTIRVVDPVTDEVTLYAKTVRHLFSHVLATLEAGERDLFVEQVLSEQTKRQAYDAGRDPAETFDMALADLDQIRVLFARMPQGDLSARVQRTEVSRNRFRLLLPHTDRAGLKYIGVEVVFEKANYRLGWFVRRGEA